MERTQHTFRRAVAPKREGELFTFPEFFVMQAVISNGPKPSGEIIVADVMRACDMPPRRVYEILHTLAAKGSLLPSETPGNAEAAISPQKIFSVTPEGKIKFQSTITALSAIPRAHAEKKAVMPEPSGVR